MANRNEQIKELTDRLEEGVRDVFESGRYEEYLRVMSKFHHYSYRNILLIQMQKPDATRVAGYEAWKKKFGRQVNKGEKAIKILAPAPYKTKKEMEVIDQKTNKPMKRPDGSTVTEEVEVTIPAFRVANVFDIAQTSGSKDISPVPVGFEHLTDSDGYYHQTEKRIALREGMSERQTAAAVIHEVSHATLHALDMEHLQESLKELGKDQRTMEVEAESIAYVVCQHYGIETGENSFGYIAMWSKDRTLPELQASLKVIRDTASDIIGKIDERIRELELAEEMEKESTLLTGSESMYGIYQIVEGSAMDAFAFMGFDYIKERGITVCREDYRLVYSGSMGADDTLEGIYEKFNLERPEDFRGHSLSVSDVVLIHDGEKNTAHYVDSIGFREVRDFLKDRDAQIIGESLTGCANGAKHITKTEHLGTSRMKETIKDSVHEKSNDLGERNLNAVHKSVGSDEQSAAQIKDKLISKRPSSDKARHKRQSKRKAR